MGFCGKIYPVIQVKYLSKNKRYDERDTNYQFFFSLEQISCHVQEMATEKQSSYFFNEKLSNYDKAFRARWMNKVGQRYFDFIHNDLKEFFDWCSANQNNYQDLFSYKRPLFIATKCDEHRYRGNTIYNGKLETVEFYRLFDAYTTFQELSMYLGSQAVPQKQMPKMSDEDMASIKGFDKYSFRKDKQQKVRNK